MKLKTSRRASAPVWKRCRSSTSHSRVAKKLSRIALSYASPAELIDWRIPTARQRFPEAAEVSCEAPLE